MDQRRFRDVMGSFATGVTVVTGPGSDGHPVGLTVNSITSVSLDPAMVLICLSKQSQSHDELLQGGVFGVNILGTSGEWIARQFSAGERTRRFDQVTHRRDVTGSPILDDALAWLDCRVWRTFEAGDHTIVVGEVLGGEAREGGPLLFYRGQYDGPAP